MSIGIFFAHGWGVEPSFFSSLSQELKEFPQIHWDRGYYSVRTAVKPLIPPGKWIGIGHSFGFHKLLDMPFSGLVSVSGFIRFCSHNKGQVGVPVRILNKMIDGFIKDPKKVLKEFRHRCGIEKKIPDIINTKLLLNDLLVMRDMDKTGDLLATNCQKLCLMAKDDDIVSPWLSLENFSSVSHTQISTCLKGGHALGEKKAIWCAIQIKKWIYDIFK